jgi:D-3-phosphoglycerate dehydrogenase
MALKILLTSTSFIDTPGAHQTLLNSQNFEIDKLRGPVTDVDLLPIIGNYDAIICGDDELTRDVLEAGKRNKLKYISKYGVGLDRIDLNAAKDLGLPVTNCPGVNQVSVSEHAFALLLSFVKNIHLEYNITKEGGWKRHISTEIFGKKIAILGYGAIGGEMVKRAQAFGLNVAVYDKYANMDRLAGLDVEVANSIEELVKNADVITLHIPHTAETEGVIGFDLINNRLKKGAIIINTSRGKLVNLDALKQGLESGIVGGYLADVLDIEPMPPNYPLKDWPNVLITPHISSRTFESVERQGLFAVNNLLDLIGKL